MSEEYDPLSPEDLQLLVGLAGPIYAESKLIESYSSDNPVNNGQMDDGSMKIKRGLERMQHQVSQAPRSPSPQPFIQPLMSDMQVNQMHYPSSTMVEYPTPPPASGGDQFEFNFNPSEQVRTNNLLETISKKLTKLIRLLESSEKRDDIPKLIPKI